MQYTLTTPPAVEPVTLTDAKTHLRVTATDEDDYIQTLISAARATLENIMNRAIIEQTWTAYFDLFPPEGVALVLPMPNLISVTSIQYYDESDVLQTWDSADYTVDTDSFQGRVYPVRNACYPSARLYPKSVIVVYKAGFMNTQGSSPPDLADNVPTPIKQAILITLAHWYEVREPVIVGTNVAEVPFSAQSLIAPYRVYKF